jgi:hypothetical protein
MTMTLFAPEAGTDCDDRYWADGTAALPVLLIDEATEAITEAVHRIRSGFKLEHRDVGAASVALGDLFGGLAQLAQLCTTMTSQYGAPDPRHKGSSQNRWQTLRTMMLSAQQVAEPLEVGSAPAPVNGGTQTVPVPREDRCPRLRALGSGSWTDRCPTEKAG